MNRNKTVAVCLFMFLICFSLEAWAGELVWGPKKYVRDTGKPYVVIDSFTIDKPKGKYWLQVSNGEAVQKPGADVGVVEMRNMVSSAIIWINGEKVVTPNDFNQEVYGFTKDITLQANNTIEVEVRGKPGSYITVEIREAELNVPVNNRENDLWGSNIIGDGIDLHWEEDERAFEYIIYRAYSIDGPWEEIFRRSPWYRPNGVDYTPEAKLRDLCYRIEAIDEKGKVVRHYEPICVPKYVEKEKQSFNQQELQDIFDVTKISNIQKGLNKPLLLLASLSPMVTTDPRANKLCLSDTELTKFDAMDLSQIYKFLKDKKSFLSTPIKDVNGDLIDPYQIIYDAAQKSKINPQVILTILEREQTAITTQTRLKDLPLRRIMGWDPKNLIVPLAKKSIQEQIRDGAAQLRRDFKRLTSDPPQPTPGGWQVDVEKMTDDGVIVTPATVTAALMYAYNSEAGEDWGGNQKGVGGNARFCKWWKQFGFAKPCPEPPVPLTISGSETITRNSSAQYTASGCPSNVAWSVSGKGASISSTGLLTAGSTSCGSLLVTATCEACETSATQNVEVIPPCSPLTIVNENGSPATDTILRNNTLDFKTIGACCGAIVWSVSGTGGSITQGGILSAGPTSCGSLSVTASCPACGTSATHHIRVTNAGQWIIVSEIMAPVSCRTGAGLCCGGSNSTIIEIRGKYKYEDIYSHKWSYSWYGLPPCTYSGCLTPNTSPPTVQLPGNCVTIPAPYNFIGYACWYQKIYEWKCL